MVGLTAATVFNDRHLIRAAVRRSTMLESVHVSAQSINHDKASAGAEVVDEVRTLAADWTLITGDETFFRVTKTINAVKWVWRCHIIDPESPKNVVTDPGFSRRLLPWTGVDVERPLITQVSRVVTCGPEAPL
jgi:hypothetical protein